MSDRIILPNGNSLGRRQAIDRAQQARRFDMTPAGINCCQQPQDGWMGDLARMKHWLAEGFDPETAPSA